MCKFLDNFADMIITGIYLKQRDEARDTVTNERQLRAIASSHWEIKNITIFPVNFALGNTNFLNWENLT